MFLHFLKIAFRNIIRQKGYSFINISGLGIGLACSILILLWVQDELSFDNFNINGDNIYRVLENQYYAGGEIFPVAVTPGPLAEVLKSDFPEIINSARFTERGGTLKYEDKKFNEQIIYADSTFFEMFTYPLAQGNSKTALSNIHSVILSEKIATKYFGSENPLGKTIIFNNKYSLNVTGILKTIPNNSHIKIDVVFPFEFMKETGTDLSIWGNNSFYTYVQLQDGIDYNTVNTKIKDVIKKHNEDSKTDLYLQPMKDIHLYSNQVGYAADIGGNGDILYVKIFSIVAFFVLLIACINFMNLSTAKSSIRAKEVGVRKTIGANRVQLIKQFFSESILLTFFAFLFSLLLVALFIEPFNDLAGKQIELFQSDLTIYFIVLITAIFTGVVSGSYPAVFLSSFLPTKVLKESKSSDGGNSTFRKILVVTQFSLSIILILGTMIVFNQLKFIQNKNLGINKDNIVYMWIDKSTKSMFESIKPVLENSPLILSSSLVGQLPTNIGSSTSSFEWEGKNENESVNIHFASVDEGFQKTFKVEMADGRFYSKEFADSNSIVINESFAKIINIENLVGKTIKMWDKDLTVIGITKDFHFQKLDSKIAPLTLRIFEDWNYLMTVRLSGEKTKEALSYLETTIKNFNPNQNIEYSFLDERYNELYKSEVRMGKLFSTFSILAIFISCLGLFGLASFMAERRTKEIGIRKVLGASVQNLTYLLSKEFTKWIIVSNIIAWPIAYYFMNLWLQNFAYRVEVEIWLFPIAGIVALAIAILTVSYQAIKAALANPIKAIKYE